VSRQLSLLETVVGDEGGGREGAGDAVNEGGEDVVVADGHQRGGEGELAVVEVGLQGAAVFYVADSGYGGDVAAGGDGGAGVCGAAAC
jgi:hypothetical protein